MIRTLLFLIFAAAPISGQTPGRAGAQPDGTYLNPILPGDFQNTDVLRVGTDYFYISATKALSPGMLILRSRDLVNWQPLTHVVSDLTALSPRYSAERMEGIERGVWAGAITAHAGRIFVYFTTPDEGLFVSSASNPAGPWTPPHLMLAAPGWDDPGPLWDDDGTGYLALTNFARDPADGKTYHIHLLRLAPDGLSLAPGFDHVIHQSQGSEANKLYKIDGIYFHFFSEVTREGRVPMIARSHAILGPWEVRQLNHVSKADREPNQGTLLQSANGDWFFLTHHGTPAWEGRPASLLPVHWIDGWPVAGSPGTEGIGNMVWSGTTPAPATQPPALPHTSDSFSSPTLAPQWEWYFQPRPNSWSLTERPGALRLHATRPLARNDLLRTPDILTQRPFTTSANVAESTFDLAGMVDGQTAGLCFLGRSWAAVTVAQHGTVRSFVLNVNGTLIAGPVIPLTIHAVTLRVEWTSAGIASFSTSADGKAFQALGTPFTIANFGSFLGAKLGLYTSNELADEGFVDVLNFRYTYTH